MSDREIVGYKVRFGHEKKKGQYLVGGTWPCPSWGPREHALVYGPEDDPRKMPMWESTRAYGRVVRLTRRKPKEHVPPFVSVTRARGRFAVNVNDTMIMRAKSEERAGVVAKRLKAALAKGGAGG